MNSPLKAVFYVNTHLIMEKFKFITENISITAQFTDHDISIILSEMFPISAEVNTWGKEIYFTIPRLDLSRSRGTTDVEIGDIAYWPEGSCLCVFFGATPMSTTNKPMPASEVIVLGKVIDGMEKLEDIRDGEKITVK